MPKSTPRQRRTEARVMHAFAHGELRTGPGGKGGKVTDRKQAVAIALREAGASNAVSTANNIHRVTRTKAKQARAKTGQQAAKGKHIGAKGKRESSRARGGKSATSVTKSGAAAARTRGSGSVTKEQLYAKAKKRHLTGRSTMSKQQLQNALG